MIRMIGRSKPVHGAGSSANSCKKKGCRNSKTDWLRINYSFTNFRQIIYHIYPLGVGVTVKDSLLPVTRLGKEIVAVGLGVAVLVGVRVILASELSEEVETLLHVPGVPPVFNLES